MASALHCHSRIVKNIAKDHVEVKSTMADAMKARATKNCDRRTKITARRLVTAGGSKGVTTKPSTGGSIATTVNE
jgi:hypothetical protein